MLRYDAATSIKNKFDKNYVATNIVKIPVSDNDTYIQITSADRLDTISYDFYGTPELWYIIANANGLGKGSLWVQPGVTLRIPYNTDIYEYTRNINKAR